MIPVVSWYRRGPCPSVVSVMPWVGSEFDRDGATPVFPAWPMSRGHAAYRQQARQARRQAIRARIRSSSVGLQQQGSQQGSHTGSQQQGSGSGQHGSHSQQGAGSGQHGSHSQHGWGHSHVHSHSQVHSQQQSPATAVWVLSANNSTATTRMAKRIGVRFFIGRFS